jgi:ferrochelatase
VTDTRRQRGVLLVNLGTPASPAVRDVRRYLREFLSDPRVIDIPAPLRWLLLHGIILPFRSRRSAHAYRSIWRPEGSPLLVFSQELRRELGKELGERYAVELAMRYGEPSIAKTLERLASADVERILVVPLFPQYASSSFGSAAEAVLRAAMRRENVPPLELLGPFYDDPDFVGAFAHVARESLAGFGHDHVLISFHGLPERQVRKGDPSGRHCLASLDCCDEVGAVNRFCYRAHCFATARALASSLELPDGSWSVSFQSRLGRDPWLQPYTDRVLQQLGERGVRRVAVLCPAFVADCLETLEEIGLRAREQWRQVGGKELLLVPSLNSHPRWVVALANRVRGRS